MTHIRVYVTVEGTYYPYVNETVSWKYDADHRICDPLEKVIVEMP